LEHDHFFTNAGAFGSHNEHSEQVDSGDFEVVDDDTVSFPSHATEFGYDGDLVVDYSIDGDVVAFDVALPAQCRASAPMRMPGLFPRSRPVRGSAATCRSARRQNCRTGALLQGLHREVAMLEREIHRRLRGYVGYGATQA